MAHTIDRSALVWHSAERMFSLVSDIPNYPLFLPWCSAAEVHEVSAEQVLASIEVAKGGIRHSFTTRNVMAANQIDIVLVEGPFQSLHGRWFFEPLDAQASKVILKLDFEFSGRLAQMAFGPIFSQAANSLVDAFCVRADQVYGKTGR